METQSQVCQCRFLESHNDTQFHLKTDMSHPINYLMFISRGLLASHVPPSDGRKEQRKNRITFRRATEEQKRGAKLPQSGEAERILYPVPSESWD